MAMAEQRPTTDFGFERVPLAEKARRVRSVFDSVVERYDLMNDLMSAGTHRLHLPHVCDRRPLVRIPHRLYGGEKKPRTAPKAKRAGHRCPTRFAMQDPP